MQRQTLMWALVLGLIGLGATGALAASAAHPTANSKPAGAFFRKVDVGGLRLAIYCRGKGSPTVVLESGHDSNAGSWLGIEPTVAKTTRVCSYDRAGYGSSDARRPATTAPVPAGKVVTELHRLLRGAGIRPPYVMGGADVGGFFNRLYTKRYPAEVVGLVSLDGMSIGVPGVMAGSFGATVIGPGDTYFVAGAAAELAKRPSLGARPFVVLVGDLEATRLKRQKQLARLSTSSMPSAHSLAPSLRRTLPPKRSAWWSSPSGGGLRSHDAPRLGYRGPVGDLL